MTGVSGFSPQPSLHFKSSLCTASSLASFPVYILIPDLTYSWLLGCPPRSSPSILKWTGPAENSSLIPHLVSSLDDKPVECGDSVFVVCLVWMDKWTLPKANVWEVNLIPPFPSPLHLVHSHVPPALLPWWFWACLLLSDAQSYLCSGYCSFLAGSLLQHPCPCGRLVSSLEPSAVCSPLCSQQGGPKSSLRWLPASSRASGCYTCDHETSDVPVLRVVHHEFRC